MFRMRRSWIDAITAALILAAGCQAKTEQKAAADKPASVTTDANVSPTAAAEPAKQPAAQPQHKAVASKPKPQQPVEPLTIPKVSLSEALRANCLVNVGDTMPEAELADLDGKLHSLGSLYGQKLTVVFFWTAASRRAQATATTNLQDLMKDVAEPFGEKGVRVISIDVRDPIERMKQHVAEAGVTFPTLLDVKGRLFAKIAKDKRMPRIFLLDGQGKILWFDVEYSRDARHDLVQGIDVALQNP